MKKLATYLTVKDAPEAGFSLGKVKDNTGAAGSGSGAFAQFANDAYYAVAAMAFKYLGVVSDTDESETASDNIISIERAIGIQNENVSEYVNTTAYAADALVMRYGVQFVSRALGNVGHDPFTSPDEWLPCFSREKTFQAACSGIAIQTGVAPMDNHRDAAYRQWFELGKFNFGGDAGVNYEAWGVHLDGTTVTGVAELVAIFDVGGAGEYNFLDTFVPDVGAGIRKLRDYRGCSPMAIDAVGGNRAAIGVPQDDQSQGHWHELETTDGSYESGDGVALTGAGGTGGTSGFVVTASGASVAASTPLECQDPVADGTNGTPRTGLETYGKNYSTGVPFIIVINAI